MADSGRHSSADARDYAMRDLDSSGVTKMAGVKRSRRGSVQDTGKGDSILSDDDKFLADSISTMLRAIQKTHL